MQSSEAGVVIYRRLIGYAMPYWRAFVVAIVGMIVVAVSEPAFAALMKPMLDGSFVERDPELMRIVPLAIIALFLFRGVASFLSTYWMHWVARRVVKKLRSEMFERMITLPVSFFDNNSSGNLLSKLLYDVEQVTQASTEALTILVRDSLTVIGLLAWMFYIDWQLAMILLIGTPVIAKIIHFINGRFRRYATRVQDSVGQVAGIAEEAVEGQRVVKTFGGQSYERDRFEQANESNRRLNMKLEGTSAASVPVVQLVAAGASAAVIWFAINMEDLTVGTFVSFIASMMLLLSPTKRLTRITAILQRGIAAAESVFRLIDTPPEVDNGVRRVERVEGAVSYHGVHFAYDAEKGEVLKGVDLDIAPGQTVAFVGRSGSGKTTLASLLPRFYDVSAGSIRVDGTDVRELELENLRDQIAVVTQHITLFNDTIAANIAYGRLNGADRATIERAADAAHATDFIRNLPNGFDTMVGENGVLLSGGQRQRLAIARALLKDAPILILDEATSALDTESERHIQTALEQLMTGRTTLVIAHRLSTIERADQIVVLEQGRVVEQGRHQELLERNGRYASLYRMQFEESPAAASVAS